MKKLFSMFLCMLSFLCYGELSANESSEYNPENYVYDNHGNPIFVKVYVSLYEEDDHVNAKNSSLALQFIKKNHFFSQMLQKDHRGKFLAVPLQKKKSKDKDKDEYEDDPYQEKGWICPYCDHYNKNKHNTCQNKKCVLYRIPK